MDIIKRIFKSFFGGPVYVILFGLIFFGIGGVLTYTQRTFEQNGALASGEVVMLSENCDDDGCTYTPVVHYTTHSGKSVSFRSSYSSSPPAYDIGEIVEVIYNPQNPEKAVIKGEGQWFRIIFMIVGGIVIIFGISLFANRIRDEFVK